MNKIPEGYANLSFEEKRVLLAKLLREKASQAPSSYPLSYGQQALWFFYQLEPESVAYNIIYAARLEADLDIQALRQAFESLVSRHPILRTTYTTRDGKPVALIGQPIIDLEVTTTSDSSDDYFNHWLTEMADRPFDLEREAVLRGNLLIRSAVKEHIFLLTAHHIASDLFSFEVLVNELSMLYKAIKRGTQPSRPPLGGSYQNYVRWESDMLAGVAGEKLAAYWLKQLAGPLPVLNLPTDRPRPAVQSYEGASFSFELDEKLTQQLSRLAKGAGVTLYMTLLAAFEVLLLRYTGQEDILIGSPMGGRTRAEFERTVGYFVNPVTLRADLSGNPTFNTLLHRVRETVLGAIKHQSYPYPLLVERLQPVRDPSRSPLFQVVFVWDQLRESDAEKRQATERDSLIAKSLLSEQRGADFDLTLTIFNTGGALTGIWTYKTDLFSADTVMRMRAHFQTLLEEIVANPERPISKFPLLTAAERHQLLVEWNDTKVEYPVTQCIHQLFCQQVERTPNAVAVVSASTGHDKEQELSYGELNHRANELAHYLQSLGVGPEVLVGICVEPSLEMAVGLLAVLKAGGAYVPLDPNYPKERLAFMLKDSQVKVLLTPQKLRSHIEALSDAQLVCLDAPWPAIFGANQSPPVSATNLAYVIYTSGSTGKPKGVMIPHQALVNHSHAIAEQYHLTAHDRVLQFAALSFDVALEEIWPTWLSGGRVVLRPAEFFASLADFSHFVEKERLTVLNLPAAYWHEWVLALSRSETHLPESVRLVVVGSEKVLPERLKLWQKHVGRQVGWRNAYGPTEATITATLYDPPPPSERKLCNSVPIGRPIANTQLYVLDRHLQPTPIGVPGELHIGGAGLARGYLNRPQLTFEKFIRHATLGPNPFSPSVRLYKTGDLVRYLPNGNLEFLGRLDHQVKIRGFRIELGEIESALTLHPNVREAVVVAQEYRPNDKQLIAYVIQEEEASTSALRGFLSEKLPDYMVPVAFVPLSSWPLTPNGKVDRRALPAVDRSSFSSAAEFVAPRTPTEEKLLSIWSEIFGLEETQISVHSNFFELGGHSLLATQVISRLREVFQVDQPLRLLFERPTIADFCEVIEEAKKSDAMIQAQPTIRRVSRKRHHMNIPMSFAQQRLWFLDQLEPNNDFYNIPAALRFSGQLNVVALEQSLNEIIRRHETLRTTFATMEEQPVQVIAPSLQLSLPVVDLTHLSDAEREQDAEVRRLAFDVARQPFDLRHGPLWRVTLLRLNNESHVFLSTMHHIISDGWSIGILIREVTAHYEAYSLGRPSPLAELPIQYADFAIWQREWLSGEELSRQTSYWQQQLAGAPPILELPTDRPRPPIQTRRGRTQSFQVNFELTQSLKALSQKNGATLFMSLLAAFAALLSRLSDQSDIVIGSPIANRNRHEVESLIGFFVNTLALRIDLSGNPTFLELLTQVRQGALGAYAHQDLPFEKLVEELQPERNLSHSPLFQVMFVLQNVPMESLELPGLTLYPLATETVTAKFDITLSMEERESELIGSWEYNSDLFDPTTIRRMSKHFETLLSGIVANPFERVNELPLLSSASRHQLLVEWNDSEAELPKHLCFHQLFEAQVERTPDAVAVVFENQHLSYRDLNARANRLARLLVDRGVGPDTIVALLGYRNIDFLTAMLAIFKAGGAYLPLDPFHPAPRIAQVLQQSGTRLILAQSEFVPHLTQALESWPTAKCPELLFIENVWQQKQAEDNLSLRCRPDNLAYVIYTSGSTGLPKGAMVEHKGMLNHLYAKLQDLKLTDADIIAQNAPQSFDISVWQFLAALLVGGQVYIFNDEAARDPLQLLDGCQGITILEVVPSLLRMMLEVVPNTRPNLSKLRWLIPTGEALPPPLCRQWFEYYPNIPMINAYGPTECSDDVTHYPIYDPPSEEVVNMPIGRPVANMQMYILDSYLQPVPIGVAGELYVGGIGVGRGYLNDPQRTAKAFIRVGPTCPLYPFMPNARLYKTGDKARYLPDGNIEFLGRLDYQVKIRGFRIELGEIEAVLGGHPSVHQTVVIVREDDPGDKRLVAYVVPNPEQIPTPSDLRRYLASRLPEYMVPAAFVMLESMPLTPNGKVDRRALPAVDRSSFSSAAEFVAPRTPTEEKLVSRWSQILGLEERLISVHSNFFELGGHSLLATQVISRIRETFSVELPLRALFERSTIAEIAQLVIAKQVEQAENDALARILEEVEELSGEEVKELLMAG